MLKEAAAGPGSHSQADGDRGQFSLTFQASARLSESASNVERFLNLSFDGPQPSSLI